MLRSATSLGLRHGSRLAVANHRVVMSSASKTRWLQPSNLRLSNTANSLSRALSTQTNQEPPKKEGGDAEGEDMRELVLTPGQKVVAASRLGLWAGVFGFACVCAFYIGKELLPTKMSANTVFNGASKIIRANAQVQRQYGDGIKFYGKDHGGHREGRRNFIEHTEYTNPDDNTNRTRVRFNLEGQFASAHCFAEVSKDMASGEYVYILVQDKKSGRVITVQDNRSTLTAKRMAGGNQESASAMQQLLGGGGSK